MRIAPAKLSSAVCAILLACALMSRAFVATTRDGRGAEQIVAFRVGRRAGDVAGEELETFAQAIGVVNGLARFGYPHFSLGPPCSPSSNPASARR
jgi:hypothetical protein